MKKIFYFYFCLFSFSGFCSTFTDLAKRTSSVYTYVNDVDVSNSANLNFETLLDNQLVYLLISTQKLNSSFISLINSDTSSSKKISINEVKLNNLIIELDTTEELPASCSGENVENIDTSCQNETCTIKQRVISACNDTNCWEVNPETDRSLTAEISGHFSISTKINISDCIPNNLVGHKHVLSLGVTNSAPNILSGATIQSSLILQNDINVMNKRMK